MNGVTPGRNVHFVDEKGKHLAAIVTGVGDVGDALHLTVFEKAGQRYVLAPFDEVAKRHGTWHWIERV